MSDSPDELYKCPLCGHRLPKKTKSFLDRIRGINIATFGINIDPGEGSPYYHCNHCKEKFEDVTDVPIKASEIRIIKPEVLQNIRSWYGNHDTPTLDELLDPSNVTGIILMKGILRYSMKRRIEFRICITFNNNRTVLTCTRKKKDGSKYYVAETMGAP